MARNYYPKELKMVKSKKVNVYIRNYDSKRRNTSGKDKSYRFMCFGLVLKIFFLSIFNQLWTILN